MWEARANSEQSGWLIAFVSSIIADIAGDYPNYSWWAIAYMFFCILGVTIAIGADAIQTYHVAIVGFLAAGLVFTTSSVNSLIYWQNSAKEAAAAGFILLSMVSVRQRATCETRASLTDIDCVDLLLRLTTFCIPPSNSRFIRAPQRPRTKPQQQTHDSVVQTRYDTLFRQPATADVQQRAAGRLRDIVPSDRLPRRPTRSVET